MGKKILFILFSVIILICGIGFYSTPYWAFRNMRMAAENKDTETLNRYVDFNALKESLKANLNDRIARETGSTKNGDAMDTLGSAIATAFINPLIDAFVTPDGLAMIVRGSIPERPRSRRRSEEKAENNGGKKKSEGKKTEIETSTYYQNFNRFVVAFKEKGSHHDQIRLVFRRDGLASWKLCAMDFP